MDDLVIDFIAETREGLEALDSELVRFEQNPEDPGTLSSIFRLIHTIKGTCGFLGLPRLQHVAHGAENVLGAFRDGVLAVSPEAVSAILESVDLIRELIDALSSTGAEPDGDDSQLIALLDSVMRPPSPVAAPTPASAPAPAARAQSLIDQLGGDATLDAASEMALARLQGQGELGLAFGGLSPDRLQAAIRDSLSALARQPAGAVDFLDSLAIQAGAPITGQMGAAVFEIVADGLGALDVPPAAIETLRSLALRTASASVAEQAEVEAVAARLDESGRAPAPPPTLAPESSVVLAPTPAPAAPDGASGAARSGEGEGPAQTIRVSVDALEHLMTVVSELVLIRNQLIQTLRLEPESPFAAPLNRLNQVTSELQEGVMTTRMQPISGAWAKLPRLVRDLAQDLGKRIELTMFGQETELDRQVLELIKDPLTHMIRNAADHGLETPAERLAASKAETGRISLHARHEGGAIVIEVTDDGRGLPAARIRAKALACGLITPAQASQMSDADARQLIFAAGFSTADEVTAVSGRGVGMDVVRTNIEKIGGVIELSSVEGAGTRFTIRIPLTLTIVSALIVECCGERFAMPQSSVVELVSASGASGRTVEHINGSAVLRLRDRLLPLVSLQSLLGLGSASAPAIEGETCIVVARVGAFTFGVIVDRVFDTEEIVVKPVATVLRHLKLYSGATILGDGSVILILDLKGISIETGAAQGSTAVQDEAATSETAAIQNRSAILVFRSADGGLKAAPLANVSRIEEVAAAQIERVDGRTVVQYRGRLMPIVTDRAEPVTTFEGPERRPLLVFARGDQGVGLLVHEIVDIVETSLVADLASGSPGTSGSLIIDGNAMELIDVSYYWRQALGEAAADPVEPAAAGAAAPARATGSRRLLVIDQSPFCQLLLRPLLTQAGYDVTVAADPAAALALYEAGEQFHLIMADTSNPDEARGLAATFVQASDWHKVPLLSLALQNGFKASTDTIDDASLLQAVAGAMREQKDAA